ncbi:MAG: methyltransferase [Nocardioidaceae bacterium]|nr:methyltransferase [Nocardioidaceae bacterium]
MCSPTVTVMTFDYDAELRRYHARLLQAADIDQDARVLDVGCGAGQTTRAAGRTAASGQALGIDISAPMLARARRLTDVEGLSNVVFECGDVQVHPLPAERFTAGISRFGTMFFADPGAAFANIAQAMCPGAILTQLVWQQPSRQEWHVAIHEALTDEAGAPATSSGEAAFSLADPAQVVGILTGAGFVDVRLDDVREPVCYGADGASALDAIQSLRMTERVLRDLDATSAERALSRLRALLDARDDDGVWFESAAWLVTARRADPS